MIHTLLIVDDDPDALELLDVTLTLAGYRTVRASNGADAVRLARSQRPSAIIMDFVLPVLDGWQAARELRAISGFEGMPILGYTAQCGRREEDERVFDQVLRKPCAPEILLAAISGLLCRDCPA